MADLLGCLGEAVDGVGQFIFAVDRVYLESFDFIGEGVDRGGCFGCR